MCNNLVFFKKYDKRISYLQKKAIRFSADLYQRLNRFSGFHEIRHWRSLQNVVSQAGIS
jgi:hypothetical protein